MGGTCSANELINAYKFLVRKPHWEKHLGGVGVDRRVILKCISRKYIVTALYQDGVQ
jgi:hypothetical protein